MIITNVAEVSGLASNPIFEGCWNKAKVPLQTLGNNVPDYPSCFALITTENGQLQTNNDFETATLCLSFRGEKTTHLTEAG